MCCLMLFQQTASDLACSAHVSVAICDDSHLPPHYKSAPNKMPIKHPNKPEQALEREHT